MIGESSLSAGDDEAEGDEAGADLKRAGADRLVEDEDAADDGGRGWPPRT
jgi:hypothetical protein